MNIIYVIKTLNTKKTRAFLLSVLLILLTLSTGCATGSGANRNNYFKTDLTQPLPFSIKASDDSRGIVASPSLNSDSENFIGSLLLGGVVGAYLSTNSAAWSTLRGKYDAGEAFIEATKKFNSLGAQQEALILKLDRFEYGILPAKGFKSGRVLSFMEFSSQFSNRDNKLWSAYACDFQIKGTFFPSDEKNMLREMIETSLYHWGTLMSTGKLTEKLKGNLSGDEANCAYEVFVTEQDRTIKLKSNIGNN
ncbi:MAG: hypothetical protein EPN25_03785 [Nitrospirae bacterium]|nr:MAG: hypothetical protein EPN25_03785 [Nitrospirota bacterium]